MTRRCALLRRAEESRKQFLIFGGLIRQANTEPWRSRRTGQASRGGASHDFAPEVKLSPARQKHGQVQRGSDVGHARGANEHAATGNVASHTSATRLALIELDHHLHIVPGRPFYPAPAGPKRERSSCRSPPATPGRASRARRGIRDGTDRSRSVVDWPGVTGAGCVRRRFDVQNHPRDGAAADRNQAAEVHREDILHAFSEGVPLRGEDFLRDRAIEPEADVTASGNDDRLKVVNTRVIYREAESEMLARIGKGELGRSEEHLIVRRRERSPSRRHDNRFGAASTLVPPYRRRREVLDRQVYEALQRSSTDPDNTGKRMPFSSTFSCTSLHRRQPPVCH